MSNRQSMVLMLAVAAVLLRLVLSGKFTRAWTSLWSPSPQGGAGSSPGSSPSSRPAPSAGQLVNAGSFPDPAQFGLRPTSYHRGDLEVRGVAALDQSGLPAGHTLAADYDYGVPAGTAVYAPGPRTASYTVQPSWSPSRTAVLRAPGGGIFEILHLSYSFLRNSVGAVLHGGDLIGLSGSPSGPNEAGSGAHVAVVTDTQSDRYLRSLP